MIRNKMRNQIKIKWISKLLITWVNIHELRNMKSTLLAFVAHLSHVKFLEVTRNHFKGFSTWLKLKCKSHCNLKEKKDFRMKHWNRTSAICQTIHWMTHDQNLEKEAFWDVFRTLSNLYDGNKRFTEKHEFIKNPNC